MSIFPLLFSRNPSPILQPNSNRLSLSKSTEASSNFLFNLESNTQSPTNIENQTISNNNKNQNPSLTTFSASRRGSTVDNCGRFCSLPGPDGSCEILVSLCYLADQSKLIVVVEKATNINAISSTLLASSGSSPKIPNTFVRISLLSHSGSELAKQKSEVIKSISDPTIYHETAVFQIARANVKQCSVLIQIFCNCGSLLKRKVALGYVCIGNGEGIKESDVAARQHWEEMIQGTGITVDKWHNIIKTPYQSKN